MNERQLSGSRASNVDDRIWDLAAVPGVVGNQLLPEKADLPAFPGECGAQAAVVTSKPPTASESREMPCLQPTTGQFLVCEKGAMRV